MLFKVMALSGHFGLPARAGVLEQVTYTGPIVVAIARNMVMSSRLVQGVM